MSSDYSDYEEDIPVPKKTKKQPLSNVENTINSKPNKNNKNVSEQYQKLSQLEHILKRPDTYIGSVEKFESELWILNDETESMEKKKVNIVPGLFKIFDEILVNAADNKIRDPSMKKIDVKIDPENNIISVKNDGRGIPIQIHDKEKIYIPELIFGNLLTSSNYDDDEKKVTGGRNGYGAKLCNIFSTEFTVKTADKSSNKIYTQTWKNNMSVTNKPKIVEMKKKEEYTEIIFKPDLAKFGMDKLDDDILGVLKRRVYDLSGSVKDISVTLNGKRLKIRNFKQYIEMYVKSLEKIKAEENNSPPPQLLNEDSESSTPQPTPIAGGKLPTIVHQIIDDRWELGFAISDGNFNQVSFVNSIATTSGGSHVNLVSDLIVEKLMEQIKKKNKRAMIKPFQIKSNMFLFINCLIENPAFTSQTKEQLTTRVSQFGGKKLSLPDDFIKKILRTGIIDNIMDIAQANADKALKKNDGSRKNRITGYPKLEDANKAGTKDGRKCTLILTEGDSALTLAVAGLAVVGRDLYGCYPLRGKMLNVREASADQILKNAEIQAIKQIMGLQHKKRYDSTNINSLRYGHIMIMTDQDHDGSHIKGLIINFLETSFPGLLEIPEFLIEFITPIVKVKILTGPKKKTTLSFYNMPEYEAWRDDEGLTCSYKQKYYKGLGTSSPAEAREYFSQLDKHLKKFHSLKEEDKSLIDLAFSKKKADERKEWLRCFQPGTFLDPTLKEIPISDFINKELILFSMADNIRSIPSVLDGFKPSQRKILYGCYKRNLTGEIKVSQLVGYIGEHTGYHHGEASLTQSIVSLAQDFVGSNNLNVLVPHGGFGSRAAGGKDASAARYIFTELSALTRKVFNPLDNPLLTYLQDDEQTVEPEWYLPVLPMLLVNGTDGIGSGWSTNIPPFNPKDIVSNIRAMMNGDELMDMKPWFRGWDGFIERISKDKFKMEGNIEQIDDNTIEITELPARMWTITMKEYLLQGLAGTDRVKPWIKDMQEQHGIGIKFVITLTDEEMKKALSVGLKEKFKLTTTISTSNMVAFDPQGRIKKYDHVNQILEDYYHVRLDYYQRRKDQLATQFSNQLEKLSCQARFIKLIIDKELVVSNKKRLDLIEELQSLKFPGFDKNNNPVYAKIKKENPESLSDIEEIEDEANDTVVNVQVTINSTYDYLLGMQIWSLTRERYEKLLKQRDEKEAELTELLGKSAKDLWNSDLDEFLLSWDKSLEEYEEQRNSIIPDKSSKKKRAAPKRPRKAIKKEADDDDGDEDFGNDKKKNKTAKQSTLPFKKTDSSSSAPKVKTEPKPEFPSIFGSGSSPFGKNGDKKGIFGGFGSSSSKFSQAFSAFKKQSSPLGDDDDGEDTKRRQPKIVVSDNDEDDDDIVEKPKVKTASTATKRATTTKAKTAKAKTAPSKKATRKSSKGLDSDDDDILEISDLDSESTPAPSARGARSRRATTKKSYAIEFSDNDDEEMEEEEEEDGDDGDDDDEDDYSDFE
ncbi:hypothetical protein B5S30_g3016 [[Candida] boidinii]|nr:hypothetical protein B5S30_g3016 [[Candida] boidinii]